MQKKTLVSACLVISGVFLVFILIILFFRPSGSDVGGTDTTAVHITSANGEELPALQYDGQVAWIDVPGTAISGAVMQADDNDYYLRRNELGEDDIWGCYFMDYECTPQSQNLIIYGHSLEDDENAERFSQLKRFSSQDFAKEHQEIRLIYDGVDMTYTVISAGSADASTDTLALITNPTSETMAQMLEAARARSDVDFDLSGLSGVDVADQLLTLVTCTSDTDTRYVVVAKRTA